MINERHVINFDQDTAKVIQMHRWNLSMQLPNNLNQTKGDLHTQGHPNCVCALASGQSELRPERIERCPRTYENGQIATGYSNMDFHPYHKKKFAKKLIRNICTTQPNQTICYNVFCIKTPIKFEERVEEQMARKTMIEGFLIFTRYWQPHSDGYGYLTPTRERSMHETPANLYVNGARHKQWARGRAARNAARRSAGGHLKVNCYVCGWPRDLSPSNHGEL